MVCFICTFFLLNLHKMSTSTCLLALSAWIGGGLLCFFCSQPFDLIISIVAQRRPSTSIQNVRHCQEPAWQLGSTPYILVIVIKKNLSHCKCYITKGEPARTEKTKAITQSILQYYTMVKLSSGLYSPPAMSLLIIVVVTITISCPVVRCLEARAQAQGTDRRRFFQLGWH